MQHDTPFAPLLLITLLAVAVPLLVSRIKVIRLQGVVEEIIAGMVIGQSGLDLVEHLPYGRTYPMGIDYAKYAAAAQGSRS